MRHYHSTQGISSKLLTAQAFSLATVGKRRQGNFPPATRQAAAHPRPHHSPLHRHREGVGVSGEISPADPFLDICKLDMVG